jgi:type IV/VI secretion system ImpK/VasF family protein
MRLAQRCSPFFLFIGRVARGSPEGLQARWVRSRCQEILAEIETGAQEDPETAHHWPEARFALCALADAQLINLDWPGRAEWEASPLTQHYDGIANAGDEFYDRIDRVRGNDEVAEVYFRALALGFQGRLRQRPEERRDLIRDLYTRIPDRVSKSLERLTPSAYQYCVERDMTQLPSLTIVQVVVVLVAQGIVTEAASASLDGAIRAAIEKAGGG